MYPGESRTQAAVLKFIPAGSGRGGHSPQSPELRAALPTAPAELGSVGWALLPGSDLPSLTQSGSGVNPSPAREGHAQVRGS